jgi:hypothetical protein
VRDVAAGERISASVRGVPLPPRRHDELPSFPLVFLDRLAAGAPESAAAEVVATGETDRRLRIEVPKTERVLVVDLRWERREGLEVAATAEPAR